ncbi:hypothetical protein J3D55_002440 [Chryseobacterium ginsenosidimutans]|nr:hypothetical protein [Chryseobacterium ginsenosidimutans]
MRTELGNIIVAFFMSGLKEYKISQRYQSPALMSDFIQISITVLHIDLQHFTLNSVALFF